MLTKAQQRAANQEALRLRLAASPIPRLVAEIRQRHRPEYDEDLINDRLVDIGPYCAECSDGWPCDFYLLAYRRRGGTVERVP